MDAFLIWAQNNLGICIASFAITVVVYRLLTMKKRRQKKLSKLMRQHGLQEHQRRFQS